MKHLSGGWLAFFLLVIGAFEGSDAAGAEAEKRDPYIEALIEEARRLELYHDTQWLRLGHYQPRRRGGYLSEADGDDFFLADGGKSDPQAELEKTIEAIFTQESMGKTVLHPYCQFPARGMYLAEKLQVDLSRVPRQACPEFRDYLVDLNPAGISYIFSSYYISQPASAFGHSFLRVNKRAGTYITDQRQELLDTGIDFTAAVDTNNSALYAFKGLFGFFPGYYKKLPYYYKVREYNDYESRDIWSYELDLTDQQLLMLLAHLWELGTTHFDYYYLGENCSYHILGAIEAALPEASLLDDMKGIVLPADTVKTLYEIPGLIAGFTYRPALKTQFERRLESLDRSEKALIIALSRNPTGDVFADMPEARQIAVLDATLDYIDLKYATELLIQEESEAKALKQTLLKRRAAIPLVSPALEFEPPTLGMAHNGHGSSRVQVALGSDYNQSDLGSPFIQVSYRSNLHDLADNPVGYPNRGQIEFMPITLRYQLGDTRPRIEKAYLLDVMSLTDISRFDMTLSYDYRMGFKRIYDEACSRCLVAVGELANGFAKSYRNEAITFYGMAQLGIQGSPDYAGAKDYPIGGYMGPIAGLRLRMSNRLLLLARYEMHFQPFQTQNLLHLGAYTLRFSPTQNLALGVEGRVHGLYRESTASFYWYF